MPGLGSKLKAVIEELRRRKVVRVGAVYLVTAWAVIQVADVLLPALNLPPWTLTLVVVLALLGFPLALALAWAFNLTSDGLLPEDSAAGEEGSSAGEQEARRAIGLRPSVAFILGILVTLSLAWVLLDERGDGPAEGAALDPRAVAVLPFRVAGAETEVSYLREGMMDLLSTKLTGETGLHAVDPAAVLNLWSGMAGQRPRPLPLDSALRLARRLGAGQLLRGSVTSVPGGLVLGARLLASHDGKLEAEATVEGPPDSLPALVDRLAATLLSLEAGEEERLSVLTSTSLPALRAYLTGMAAYRRGDFNAAARGFDRALDADSTFALAGMGLYRARGWIPGSDPSRGIQVAWERRDRLAPKDRAVLEAALGPRYPRATPIPERIRAWEEAVDLVPERPEVWYGLGDQYFHFGSWIGIEDWRERASEYLSQALAVDSSFTPARLHLMEIAAGMGDGPRASDHGRVLLAGNPDAFTRWYVGTYAELPEQAEAAREAIPEMETGQLIMMMGSALFMARGVRDADRAARVLRERTMTADARRVAYQELTHYSLARGRTAEAVEATRVLGDAGPWPSHRGAHLRLIGGLYGDMGRQVAATAAAQLEGSIMRSGPDAEGLGLALDRCMLEQWRVAEGSTTETDDAVTRIRQAATAGASEAPLRAAGARLCALLLETQLAVAQDRPEADRLVERLDSLMRRGPAMQEIGNSMEAQLLPNLVLARIFAQRGETDRALAAARRRPYWGDNFALLISEYLQEEARAAARMGRREEALRAYDHYLALRANASPAVGGEVERMRREREELEGSGTPRAQTVGSTAAR